jgi:hypothetical protein
MAVRTFVISKRMPENAMIPISRKRNPLTCNNATLFMSRKIGISEVGLVSFSAELIDCNDRLGWRVPGVGRADWSYEKRMTKRVNDSVAALIGASTLSGFVSVSRLLMGGDGVVQ